jgi:hypothetical protein
MKVETLRVDWVNAEAAWAAPVGKHTVLVSDYGTWLSVQILVNQNGAVRVRDDLTLERGHEGNAIQACTTCVADPYEPGSAIPNPTSLKPGTFAYRTQSGPAHHGDHVVLPDDIVEYLVDGLN